MIRRAEMLEYIDYRDHKGRPKEFSFAFVKCNRLKREGGAIVRIERATRYRVHGEKSVKPRSKSDASPKSRKVHDNYLRTIIDLDTNRIIQPHVMLIVEFNGEKVIT
jgi:hypothetical protein